MTDEKASDLTAAQRLAVQSLAHRGGEGVIDRYGRVVAAGQVLGKDAATWLRLMTFHMITTAAPHRIALTESGWLVAEGISDAASGEPE